MNVLLIIFNRPKLTARVFEQIRKSRPAKLFIAADGPRDDIVDEKQLCEESRAVIGMIDWPCEIETRFQENNLGCKMHVSSAITWFFNNVEEGIILEDDCLPVPSFFLFCTKLLDKYKHEESIMHITVVTFWIQVIFRIAHLTIISHDVSMSGDGHHGRGHGINMI